jgi:hypothetical protein
MSPAILAALQAKDLQPVIFVQITFRTATVYLWSGFGSTTWNGQIWSGLGPLLLISTPDDGATVEAKGIVITLSGLDANLLPDCLNEFQLGAPAIVYLGLYSGEVLIDSPIISWSGRTDQPTIDVPGEDATISINCENRLIDMNVAVDRRYTQQDQQMDWPGDLGLQFVSGLQELTIYWGQVPNSTNNI